MRLWHRTALVLLLAVVLLSSGSAAQQQAAKPAAKPAAGPKTALSAAEIADRKREAERRRLFRSEEPVPITLTADFKAVMRDRNPKSTATFPATIAFAANDGSPASMPLKIRTRGHSRRNPATCSFAPLRLEFDKTLTKGTLFDGHGALKLGTHCRRGTEEVILREYAIYRMYNLLTPKSFRARVAKVTYMDSVTKKVVAEEDGLFIEDDDDVAKRMEGRVITLDQAVFARMDQETLTLMTLFEYMIGNTDFSVIAQHNVVLVQTPDIRRFTVPYDWDYSGIVESGYAAVGRGLPITSVYDRLYRGPCRTVAEWQPYVDKMKAAKAEIVGVLDAVTGLSQGYRRSAKGYLEQFFKTLDSPYNFKKELIDPCVKVGI